MKNVIICYVVLLAAVLPTQAQPASSCNEKAFQEIIAQWKDGYNNGDAAKVAALYAEDANYLTQHFVTGIVHGKAAIQAYVQRGIDARYQVESIKILRQECSGDFAYAITRYDSNNGGQKAFGVNLVVLKKTAGRWLIVAHEAAVPDPATAVQSLEIPEKH
jgi:uncharacterized protein (TIGR02246 family)